MRIDQVLAALETALAPTLLSAHKLKLMIADTPDSAYNMLKAAPQGGIVVLNVSSDEAPANLRGSTTDVELLVTVAAARGLAAAPGADTFKTRPNGRENFFTLFHSVVQLFRSVVFATADGSAAHPDVGCANQLRYTGSEWLEAENSEQPIRDRMARFELRICLDRVATQTVVPLPDAS